MKPKQNFLIFKKTHRLFQSIFKNLTPRYQLSLDHSEYDMQLKKIVHCFKSYGDHTFLKLTFDQIKLNSDLLCSINPQDLLRIFADEFALEQKSSKLYIAEMLRNNNFILTDKKSYQHFSGEEICDNALLIERINNIDLYKIAFSTGFNQGRSLSKIAHKKQKENDTKENILKLVL